MLSLGNSIKRVTDANNFSLTLGNMLISIDNAERSALPKDRRFAVAIDNGLLELCLTLIVRFGGADQSEVNVGKRVEVLLYAASQISLNDKCAKAIASRRDTVIKSVQTNESKVPKTEECQQSLLLLKSILNMSATRTGNADATCMNCAKHLQKEDIRRCGRCKTVYCSRECQVSLPVSSFVHDVTCHSTFMFSLKTGTKDTKLGAKEFPRKTKEQRLCSRMLW